MPVVAEMASCGPGTTTTKAQARPEPNFFVRSGCLLGAISPQITRVCRPRVFSAKERVFVLLLCFACFLLKLLQSRTEIHANGEVYLVLTENQ